VNTAIITVIPVQKALNARLHLLKCRYKLKSCHAMVSLLLNTYSKPDQPPPPPPPTGTKKTSVSLNILKTDLEKLKQLQILLNYKCIDAVLEVIVEQAAVPPPEPPKPANPVKLPKPPKPVKPPKTTRIKKTKTVSPPPGEVLFENILAYLDRQRKARNKARREAREA
jgi:hypothetical protein